MVYRIERLDKGGGNNTATGYVANASASPDGLFPKVLKTLSPYITFTRFHIVNLSIQTSQIPEDTFATSFTHYSIVWTVKRSAVGTRLLTELKCGLL